MATREIEKAGQTNAEVHHTPNNAWEVMKPFVRFGVKATGIIAGALITIIKHIPKPETKSTNHRKSDSIIKI